MSKGEYERLRTYLDKKFKPIFDQYKSDGGIPLSDLKELLGASDLPIRKIHGIVDAADADGDKRITYDEFLDQVLSEDEKTLHKLKVHQRVLNRAVLAIAPDFGREHQLSVAVDSGYDNIDGYNWGKADVDNYIEAYDCRPPPLFIPIITAAEIAVFIYYVVIHSKNPDPSNFVTTLSGAPINSIFIYNPAKRHEVWRFLTYMFIHVGYLHLAFNCILQIVLGILLELVHKVWRVGLVYLLGVIAGSLAHSISDPFVLLAGASGGCYALIGAHLATVIMNWDLMQEGWLKDPLNFISSGVVRLILIILLGGGDTGLAIYARLKNVDEKTRVGFTAHLGGFLAGLLLGVAILRNLKVEKWEKVFFWICIIIFMLFASLAILFNVFCSSYNRCPASNWST
ncbi:hypothetical protein MN116_003971 [Schistosoma mekongi]|uniref:EF-hand domain-containing protein n=1 Tax=Schistosoma mekongi TaxID=38744 RepID=A0AAE1ZG72_SCHME|nr:hypothetical protein MN116_003971 [Schistosoma mekongi]